jgi:hypothetical protein
VSAQSVTSDRPPREVAAGLTRCSHHFSRTPDRNRCTRREISRPRRATPNLARRAEPDARRSVERCPRTSRRLRSARPTPCGSESAVCPRVMLVIASTPHRPSSNPSAPNDGSVASGPSHPVRQTRANIARSGSGPPPTPRTERSQ